MINHAPASFTYFMAWLAQIVQQPGNLIGIAVVLLSKEGAGKNILLEFFANMIGKEYYFETASPATELFGKFCNGRKNRLLIDIDETKSKDTFALSEELKNIITSETLNYEQKGVDPIKLRNFARIIFTTNNDLCIKLTANARRYVIFEASSERIGDSDYFTEFASYMKDVQNQKAIMEYLRSIDISKINWIRDRPLNEAYRTLQQQCAELHIRFLEYLHLQHIHQKVYTYTGRDLFDAFKVYLMKVIRLKEDGASQWNATRFGKKLTQLIGDYSKAIIKHINVGSTHCRTYEFHQDEMKLMLEKFGMLTEISYMFLDDDNVPEKPDVSDAIDH